MVKKKRVNSWACHLACWFPITWSEGPGGQDGLRKVKWLSMAQQAAFTSLKTAMQVLQESKPEIMYETLREEKEGVQL